MQLAYLGSDYSNKVASLTAALAAQSPPLTPADFDPAKYNAMYPDTAAQYPNMGDWNNHDSPFRQYLDAGYAANRTFTVKDSTLARQIQDQFAQADFVAAKAMQAAGVTGANFDSAAFAAAHQGDPAWYATWSPWQFYCYYGLAMGYPFPVLGGSSTSVAAPAASSSYVPATSVATIQAIPGVNTATLGQTFLPSGLQQNPFGLQWVNSGLIPWMTWLVQQRPDLQGAVIHLEDAQNAQNWYAQSQNYTNYPTLQTTQPVSASAVLPTGIAPTQAQAYSPYQTNYAVAPGIPDTGETGIPGTGTGAPSGPATYDQLATPAATQPAQAGLGWLAVAVLGGWYWWEHSKKGKKGRGAAHAIS